MESHDYYARINGKDYPVAWGFQIMEEMGETLDSGSITIPHLFEIISLKPYDDVIIHDYLPNVTPEEGGLPNRPLGKVFSAGEGHFYKHMVVASYTREKVNLTDEREKTDDSGKKYFSRAYNYRIQLKSETCKLETVQLPNKTITQPMSVADGTASETISASFKFGGDSKKYTLPYGTENSSAGKSFQILESVKENQTPLNIDDWRVLRAYVGDDDVTTADYSSFLTMRATASLGEAVVLPNWAISGVSTVQEDFRKGLTGIKYFDSWGSASIHHPKKHWIVRKLKGKTNRGWESRSVVLERIKEYLSGTDDDEIINSSLTDSSGTKIGRDIASSDAISVTMVNFPSESASYIIYLYCEPEIVSITSIFDGSELKTNLYGMTDNSNGTTPPTESDEFLCAWGTEAEPFSVSDGTAISNGALSVYEVVRQAVEIYSPYIKSKDSAYSDKWEYRRKFSIGDDVKAIFSSVAAPENQWNCPNLRDFLTRLMYVKDCIPVVHDNVINCMSLSKRGVIPFDDSKGLFGVENYAMDGSSYCDRLIRTYNDGLSKDNVVKCVERVGFRNSDSATLTLESLRLELAHPIYRITKIMMCHYNTMTTTDSDGTTKTYKGVIKHDITPLVLMNSQRNLLSEDWASLNAAKPESLKELAKYKYATIGYDVGSRYITGWGAKYTYPSCVFFSGTKTVIENIFTFANSLAPYGSNSFALMAKLQKLAGDRGTSEPGAEEFTTGADSVRKALYSENVAENSAGTTNEQVWGSATSSSLQSINLGEITYAGIFSNLTQKMKSLFFLVEYEGYVSASIVASKDFHDGDVVSRDNASSSLSFVESDGANQKEKVNRLGNAIITQPVRYSNREDIEELAQVWDGYSLSDEEREQDEDVDTSGRAKEHDDEVLYQRKMVFERDFIQVAYTFCRNYVLRNYFTSVFAKRRPFALTSYDESVERQENRTLQLRFSADSFYYQPASMSKVANYDEYELIARMLSFYKPTEYDENGEKVIANGVDSCYYMVFPSKNFAYAGQCGVFATDCQKFTSGNSACFSVSMQDSASGGVFVSDWNPTLGSYLGNLFRSRFNMIKAWKNAYSLTASDAEAADLVTGSKQNWLMFPVDPDTGELYSMRFGAGFKENDYYAIDTPSELQDEDAADYQLLPLMDAAVKSADGETYIWFGKNAIGEVACYGHGEPRLIFERDSNYGSLAYSVNFSNSSATHRYDDFVHEWNESSYSTMLFGSGAKKGRQVIREFLSAKFVGRETESSEETDTCVFKDGKERVSVTMQVEPVSEDNRIQFSDRMMKLSDAIGGCEKNYVEISIGREMKAIVGLTIRKYRQYKQAGDPTIFNTFYMTACLPSVTILVQEGTSLSKSISIQKMFLWLGTGDFYAIYIDKIDGQDSEGNLLVTCRITTSATTEETIVFRKNDDSEYIMGRTNSSKLAKDWALFLSATQSGYAAYSMVDDGFLFGQNSRGDSADAVMLKFDDEQYVNGSGSGVTQYPVWEYEGEGSLLAINNDSSASSFPAAKLYVSDEYCLREESMGYTPKTSFKDEAWDPVSIASDISVVPTAIANVDIDSKAKSRNMYWVLGPIMSSREASWDVRDSLDDSEFDEIDTGNCRSEKIATEIAFSAKLNGTKGTAKVQSAKINSVKDFISSVFPYNRWDNEITSVTLESWSASAGAVTELSARLNSDGTFTLIGTNKTPFASNMKIPVSGSVWFEATCASKIVPPVSIGHDTATGKYSIKVQLEQALTGERSIRLYYKEGREYHFVFGANLGAKADEGKSGDVIYPSNDAGNIYYIYVSVLDDRSKTVMDAATGDPTYKVVDWLDEEHKDAVPYNACVKKG